MNIQGSIDIWAKYPKIIRSIPKKADAVYTT